MNNSQIGNNQLIQPVNQGEINHQQRKNSKNKQNNQCDKNNQKDSKQNTNQEFFYIVSPLISFYFFKLNSNQSYWNNLHSSINNSGVLISNIYNHLENKLKENGIVYHPIIKLQSITKSISKKAKHNTNLDKFQFVGNYEELDQAHNSLVYIKNTHSNLFFNLLVNDFEDNFFKIFSPYPFQSSIYKTCKISVEFIKYENKTSLFIRILGCTFHYKIKEIMTMLENEFNEFSVKLQHFPKTQSYYVVNSKLNIAVEKIEYKNGDYYIKNTK